MISPKMDFSIYNFTKEIFHLVTETVLLQHEYGHLISMMPHAPLQSDTTPSGEAAKKPSLIEYKCHNFTDFGPLPNTLLNTLRMLITHVADPKLWHCCCFLNHALHIIMNLLFLLVMRIYQN